LKEENKKPDNKAAEAKPQEENAEAKKAAELASLLNEKEAALKEANDKHLRLYAEFDNYRKRVQAEKEELSKTALSALLKELLTILDSFERAQESFEKHINEKEELIKGVALIHRQFEDILAKNGIKKIETKDKPFDPQLHEAIMQQEAAGVATHTVLEEVQKGYLLNDKLLRPAMVIVAK